MKYVLKQKSNKFMFFNFVTEQWGPIEDATKFGEKEKKYLDESQEVEIVNLLDFGEIHPLKTETINYGILGNGEVVRDEDGYIEIPVIIQESGTYAGPPPELRIHEIGIFGEDEFNRQYTAKLNSRTDLPFFLGKAKIQVDRRSLVQHTIESNREDGIEPLAD